MITPLNEDLNIVVTLDDEPNDEGGLTPVAFKAKFDEGPNAIKDYINDTLIPELADERAGVTTEITAAVAAAQIQSGNMPAGGTAGQVMVKNSGTNYDYGWGTTVADPVNAGDIANKGYVDNLDPIGSVKIGVTNPFGSKGLLCNGAALDTTAYPALAVLINDAVSDNLTVNTGAGPLSCSEVIKYGDYFVKRSSTTIQYATDPTGTWTSVTMTSFVGTRKIKVVNGYLCVLGNTSTDQQIAYCTDPSGTWTYTTVLVSTSQIIYDLVYDGTYYYALLFNSGVSTQYIYYCATINGTYTAGGSRTSTASSPVFFYNNGYIVVFYSSGAYLNVWYMTTAQARTAGTAGTAWNTNIDCTNSLLFKALHDGTRWVVAVSVPISSSPNAAYILYSSEVYPTSFSLNILELTLPLATQVKTFKYLDNKYYILLFGTVNIVIQTEDVTKEWDYLTLNTTASLSDLTKESNRYVFASSTNVYYCPAKRLPIVTDDVLYTYIKALP